MSYAETHWALGVHGLVGQLDPLAGQRRADPGHRNGLLGGQDRRRVGQVGRGREAPHPVDQDPHGQAGVGVVAGGRQPGVPEPDRAGADPLDPQVGVAGPEVARPRQRGVGEMAEGESGEVVVDTALVGHEPKLSTAARGASRRAGSGWREAG